MANVMFKRGTQSALNNYLLQLNTDGSIKTSGSQAVDGAFYLTSDTNRLYIGKDVDGNGYIKAVPVNQGVIPVDSISALPKGGQIEAGQFYYTTTENILCVYSKGKWVQINPDTDTKITTRTTSGDTDSTTGFVVVSDVITQNIQEVGTTPDDSTAERFTSKFAVQGIDGVNVSIEEYTDGSVKRPVIKISQDPYTLTAAVSSEKDSVTFNLGDGHSTDSVTLTGGTGVKFSSTTNDNVTITVHNTTLNDADGTAKNTLKFNDQGVLTSTVTDSDGNSVDGSVTPIIQYAPDSQGTATETARFANGTAVLSVYSKTQIDDKLRTLDAMVYQGTVGTGGTYTSLPTSEVKKGYTYKFVSKTLVGDVTVDVGDVAIANGTEGSDGYLGTITWDIIPSGDDAEVDTTYWTESIEAGTKLKEYNGDSGSGNDKGGIQLVNKDSADAADKVTYLEVANDTSINTGTKNTINKVVIKHKEQANLTAEGKTVTVDTTELTQKEGQNLSLSVPVLSYDKAGHITKVESQTYVIKDTKFTYDLEYLKTASASSTYDNNGGLSSTAKIEASLKDESSGTRDIVDFNITSSTIAMNANGNDLVMNIEWGSF